MVSHMTAQERMHTIDRPVSISAPEPALMGLVTRVFQCRISATLDRQFFIVYAALDANDAVGLARLRAHQLAVARRVSRVFQVHADVATRLVRGGVGPEIL